MGQAERANRTTVLKFAQETREVARECREVVNNQGKLLQAQATRLSANERAIDDVRLESRRGKTALSAEIEGLRTDFRDFQSLTFIQRLRWLLTGKIGRGMVSGEIPGQATSSKAAAAAAGSATPHETPRPITSRSHDARFHA